MLDIEDTNMAKTRSAYQAACCPLWEASAELEWIVANTHMRIVDSIWECRKARLTGRIWVDQVVSCMGVRYAGDICWAKERDKNPMCFCFEKWTLLVSLSVVIPKRENFSRGFRSWIAKTYIYTHTVNNDWMPIESQHNPVNPMNLNKFCILWKNILIWILTTNVRSILAAIIILLVRNLLILCLH